MNDGRPVDDAFEPEGLLSSIGYLLVQMGRESRRRWVRMLAGHGLTQHQFGILMTLTGLPTASQRQLSETIDLDPRNAVAAFEDLQQRGLIVRQIGARDRRSRQVGLTAAGRALTLQLAKTGQEVEAGLLAPLSDGERASLHELLLKLYVAVEPPAERGRQRAGNDGRKAGPTAGGPAAGTSTQSAEPIRPRRTAPRARKGEK
jgi:DNA-binding MarR family transcriptional regulator